jgi:putative acyl-CoA dehydrogenase
MSCERSPGSRNASTAVVAEIRLACDQRLEAFVSAVLRDVSEAAARRVAEGLALALQASLLIRFSPRPLADAFCATRISADPSRGFGALPAAVDIDGILSAS